MATSKAKKTPPAETTEQAEVKPVVENVVAEEKRSYRVKKDLDPNMIVPVKNGFNGTLIYKSRKTGERFRWDAFGDEQDMELSELKAARNASKDFFINNWFLFDDPEVVEWLGVSQYYKYALDIDAFDKLYQSSPEEIVKTVKNLSNGQKSTVKYRAKQLISEGVIDSIKVISALEKALGTELIER